LLSVIYAALTAQTILPYIPYFAWAVIFTVSSTAINARGIQVTAKTSTVMMCIMAFARFYSSISRRILF